MRSASVVLILLLMASPLLAQSQTVGQTGFSNDRAYSHLRVLAGDIGPRPMGSPAEHRAMQYALEQLKFFGCQDTFLMPMRTAAGVNTSSGIAVGVLKGETKRTIIVGGHIDSEGPEVPGANDNGSGAACVLEIARVLCGTPHHSTILFCLWGGEEEGLRGSEYFVANYPGLDSVAFMLQLDMVDGKGPLDIDPDGAYQVSAPRWFVDAAYDEFFNHYHHDGLRYPSAFATLNSAGTGATGSDHASFLARRIPAIDFTSDIDYPIHTPLDNLANFDRTGFSRAGETVIGLVERFDGGQPVQGVEQYWLYQIGTTPLFVPHWCISVYVVLAFLASILLCVVLFRREGKDPAKVHVRWSGLKLLLVALVVNAFAWTLPSAIGLLNGYRMSWAGHFTAYVMFGILAGFLGLWLILQWILRVHLSHRVAPFLVRSLVLPLVLAAIPAAFGLEVAIYPATIALLIVLAVWIRRPLVGMACLAAASWIAWHFVMNESSGLMMRMLTLVPPSEVPHGVMYHVGFAVFSTFLTYSFVYACAALVRAVGRDFLRLHAFASKPGLLLVLLSLIIFGTVLVFEHPYNAAWQPFVKVRQTWNAFDTTGAIHIQSSEWMRGTIVHWGGKDTVLEKAIETTLPGTGMNPVYWCSTSVQDTVEKSMDSTIEVSRLLTISTPVRPFIVVVSLESRIPFEAESWQWSEGVRRAEKGEGISEKRKVFTWYSFPSTPLVIPLELILHPNQTVTQNVEITYDTLATPVQLEHAPGCVSKRMVITRTDTLRVPGSVAGLADKMTHETAGN